MKNTKVDKNPILKPVKKSTVKDAFAKSNYDNSKYITLEEIIKDVKSNINQEIKKSQDKIFDDHNNNKAKINEEILNYKKEEIQDLEENFQLDKEIFSNIKSDMENEINQNKVEKINSDDIKKYQLSLTNKYLTNDIAEEEISNGKKLIDDELKKIKEDIVRKHNESRQKILDKLVIAERKLEKLKEYGSQYYSPIDFEVARERLELERKNIDNNTLEIGEPDGNLIKGSNFSNITEEEIKEKIKLLEMVDDFIDISQADAISHKNYLTKRHLESKLKSTELSLQDIKSMSRNGNGKKITVRQWLLNSTQEGNAFEDQENEKKEADAHKDNIKKIISVNNQDNDHNSINKQMTQQEILLAFKKGVEDYDENNFTYPENKEIKYYKGPKSYIKKFINEEAALELLNENLDVIKKKEIHEKSCKDLLKKTQKKKDKVKKTKLTHNDYLDMGGRNNETCKFITPDISEIEKIEEEINKCNDDLCHAKERYCTYIMRKADQLSRMEPISEFDNYDPKEDLKIINEYFDNDLLTKNSKFKNYEDRIALAHQDPASEMYPQHEKRVNLIRLVNKRAAILNKKKKSHVSSAKYVTRSTKDKQTIYDYISILTPKEQEETQDAKNKKKENSSSSTKTNKIIPEINAKRQVEIDEANQNIDEYVKKINTTINEDYRNIFNLRNVESPEQMNKLIKQFNVKATQLEDSLDNFYASKQRALFSAAVDHLASGMSTTIKKAKKELKRDKESLSKINDNSKKNIQEVISDINSLIKEKISLKEDLINEYDYFKKQHPNKIFILSDGTLERIKEINTLQQSIEERIEVIKNAKNDYTRIGQNSDLSFKEIKKKFKSVINWQQRNYDTDGYTYDGGSLKRKRGYTISSHSKIRNSLPAKSKSHSSHSNDKHKNKHNFSTNKSITANNITTLTNDFSDNQQIPQRSQTISYTAVK